MLESIKAIEGIKGIQESGISGVQKKTGGIAFSEYLKDALNETNNLLTKSDNLSNAFAAGLTDNIHEVLIAAEKADIALQFTMQIRNKIIDAYNEIMRMQI